MAVRRQGIYVEYSAEYSKCRALNGKTLILVSTDDDCRLLNSSRRPFWPSTPGLVLLAQRENYVVGGAMTDPKGDRSKSPSQQADPDLFLRVVYALSPSAIGACDGNIRSPLLWGVQCTLAVIGAGGPVT
eukprot:1194681-Prorocentrum_minimum.AAC.2